ncbi:MAG: diacylglycerol kinase family lipid kinase [Deltaproteobacteria bacterium]|nr:MAG: diacylglycerol kinase family lipid kinase [Deltaproteobacteria bacterium]
MRVDPAKTFVILNPTAGGGRVGRRQEAIERAIRDKLGDVTVLTTERRGHGIKLAERAIWDGAELLLSVGGDGTHSEVVAGVFRDKDAQRRVTVGLLPMGTGGDFQRLLAVRGSMADYLELVKSSEPHMIDVGLVHYVDPLGEERTRVFLNECSVGMSAEVCRRVAESQKRLGSATYFIESFRAQGRHQPPTVRVLVDGQPVGDFAMNSVMISNGQYAGGGMHFAPRARLTDGLLDITVIEHAGFLSMATFSPALYMGSAGGHRLVHSFRGFAVEVQGLTEGDAAVEADGEYLGRAPLRAHVVPNGIRLLGVREDAL